MNTTSFNPYETFIGRTNGNANTKINKIYQAAAARMFYLWGEALSSQLESISDIEQDRTNDEIFEDYYNEGKSRSINFIIIDFYFSNCESYQS
jgi:hypothetical protein